jgi:HPt (histidine-containing phosphotransfer) domain-containing protein
MSGIIDLSALHEISFGDKALMRKYIGIYLINVPAMVEKMKLAAEDKDYDSMYTYVHTFKPQVKMMGIVNLLDSIDDLEKELKEQKNLPGIDARIAIMISDIEESEIELRKIGND